MVTRLLIIMFEFVFPRLFCPACSYVGGEMQGGDLLASAAIFGEFAQELSPHVEVCPNPRWRGRLALLKLQISLLRVSGVC